MRTNRAFCPRCAIKHLGKAKLLCDEGRLGYPHNIWFALANMSEAEDELIDLMPREAKQIRALRKELEEHIREFEKHVPDFESLMYLIADQAMLEEVINV